MKIDLFTAAEQPRRILASKCTFTDLPRAFSRIKIENCIDILGAVKPYSVYTAAGTFTACPAPTPRYVSQDAGVRAALDPTSATAREGPKNELN